MNDATLLLRQVHPNWVKCVHDAVPFKEHAHIDFTNLSGNQAKKTGQALARCARDRGWQYRPEAP